MPDPFEALRAPVIPVDPDPDFARRLRARVERALDLPEGVTVSNLDLDLDEPRAVPYAGAAIPYLAVADARAAIDWYVEVFGARLYDEPVVMPDDRIGHANLLLGAGILYLADEFPEIGHAGPDPEPRRGEPRASSRRRGRHGGACRRRGGDAAERARGCARQPSGDDRRPVRPPLDARHTARVSAQRPRFVVPRKGPVTSNVMPGPGWPSRVPRCELK